MSGVILVTFAIRRPEVSIDLSSNPQYVVSACTSHAIDYVAHNEFLIVEKTDQMVRISLIIKD